MEQFFSGLFPNLIKFFDEFLDCILETVITVTVSGVLSVSLGLVIGVIIVVTSKGGLYENKWVNSILGKVVNTFRSIPFIILLALMIPVTRWLVGTSIGVAGAIPPMVIGTAPFVSRTIEQALLEVDNGVIEAARSIGISKPYIIVHVLIRESLPGIIRAVMISFISLIGVSAMAGAVGGGGLGSFAIRYGYARWMMDITFVVVVILLLMVNLLQGLGNLIVKKVSH